MGAAPELDEGSIVFREGQREPTAEELAVRRAVGEAIWRHKRLGESIVIAGDDGKPITLTADEIPEEWCIEPPYPRRLPII